jgi:hypothetical protein
VFENRILGRAFVNERAEEEVRENSAMRSFTLCGTHYT